jgi:hypothetical protein
MYAIFLQNLSRAKSMRTAVSIPRRYRSKWRLHLNPR